MSSRMDRALRVAGWTLAAGLVLSVVIVAAVASVVGSMEHGTIRFNGEPIGFAELGFGHGLVALAGVAVALFVVVLVVPFAVLVPLSIVAVALVAAALAVACVLAVVLSPLILLGLAAWLLVRRARRSPAPGTTIAP